MNISGTPKYRWPNRKKINRMIQNMLSTFVQSDQRDWCTNLPSLVMAYRPSLWETCRRKTHLTATYVLELVDTLTEIHNIAKSKTDAKTKQHLKIRIPTPKLNLKPENQKRTTKQSYKLKIINQKLNTKGKTQNWMPKQNYKKKKQISQGKYVTLLHGDFYLSKDSGEEDFFDKILDLNTFENIELGFNFNDDDRDKGKEDQNDEGDQAPEVDAAPLMELLPRGLVIVVLTQRPWPLQMFLLHSNASLLNSRMYGPSWLSRYALVASHSVRVLKDSELSHNATPLNPASADWRRVLFKSA
ncbi:hypothetical protein MAR_004803 [Mya arenaria]|uniref:Uncharacterized protein n=1 Tax=Mya arenaria TaxID=6604 RepID=A0ABY7EXM8_MYAAR|nr:hypothetical protein MAR_004803 [Mya arenaria]